VRRARGYHVKGSGHGNLVVERGSIGQRAKAEEAKAEEAKAGGGKEKAAGRGGQWEGGKRPCVATEERTVERSFSSMGSIHKRYW
jgi:hypothetical protein